MTNQAENIKRSVNIAGHRTSVTLEEPFWESLKEIAGQRKIPLSRLIAEVDAASPANLSSALRIYVLNHYKRKQQGVY